MKALALAAALGLAATGALAQEKVCADRANILKGAAERYGEVLTAQALVAGGKAVFELLLSDDGSWTIIATTTDGRTCFVATGDNWLEVPPPVQGEPA